MTVIELTPQNVVITQGKIKINHPALSDGKQGLLTVTAAWCGHCKRLKPVYSEVSGYLGNSFPLFNIDAVKYASLVQKMGVKGFPSIKYISKTGYLGSDYMQDRTVDAFLKDICNKAQHCAKRS